MIPCYAELAVYNDTEVWALAFNRANSFEETSLRHFEVYFVSIPYLEANLISACNSSAVLYWWGCH